MMVKNGKPTLVYFSPDCYTQVDDTVLHHLTAAFNVVWFYMYESLKPGEMRYNPNTASEYARKNGIRFELIDLNLRRRNPAIIRFFREVADRINHYEPDIVYSCDVIPFWALTFKYIKCDNKVFGVHDVAMHSYKFNLSKLLIQCVKSHLIKRFEHIFTFSIGQHDLLLKSFGKESDMVGMCYKDFGESNVILPPLSQQVKILFFGGISLYKGLDILIRDLEELRSEGVDNLFLTIAGRGESWGDCEPLIRTREMYNLQVRFIENSEIPDLMCSHHFLALPYRNASQSGPLVTALAYNLPVIAPEYGCFSEVFDWSNAVMYKPGELKDALKRVSEMSSGEYAELREAVAVRRRDFSEESISQNYVMAFERILKGGQ